MEKKVVDQQGTPLEDYDLDRGRLEERTRTVHHDAVEGVEEQYHYITDREYPNGGKDLKRIVDVPGVEARDAWDETITEYVYVPYTEEELEAIRNAPPPPPTELERLRADVDFLAAMGGIVL